MNRFLKPCMLLFVLARSAAWSMAAEPNSPPRNAWVYLVFGKQGLFQLVKGTQWRETTIDGKKLDYDEVGRTEEHVELKLRGGSAVVRLHADYAQRRHDDQSPWHRVHRGRRQAGRAKPAPRLAAEPLRLIYFVPVDREPTPDYERKIGVLMHFVAEVYRQDLEARGSTSGGLQFQLRNGWPYVHPVRGRRPAAYYSGSPTYDGDAHFQKIVEEIRPVADPARNLVVVFAETYDPGPAEFEWPGGIASGSHSTTGGVGIFSSWILRDEFCKTSIEEQSALFFDATPIQGRTALGHGGPNSPRQEFIEDGFGAVAHEIGHALGLQHDRRQNVDIMANGFRDLRWNFTPVPDPERRARFSDDAAMILHASRYLGVGCVAGDLQSPKLQLTWAAPLNVGATKLNVAAAMEDNAGLSSISFFSMAEDSVVFGKPLTGKQQVMELTMDVAPLAAGEYKMRVMLVDVGGNMTRVEFSGIVAP